MCVRFINLCKLAGRLLSSFTWNTHALGWLKVWCLQELLSGSKWSVWCASPTNDLTTATALPLWQLLQFTGLMLSWEPLQGMLKICSAVHRWPNKNVFCNRLPKKNPPRKKPEREREALLTPSLRGQSLEGAAGLDNVTHPASTPLHFSATFAGIWNTWLWFLCWGGLVGGSRAFYPVHISCRFRSGSGKAWS